MASSARQSRTLEAYLCLRGRENEVINDFCHAPFLYIDRFEFLYTIFSSSVFTNGNSRKPSAVKKCPPVGRKINFAPN